MDDILLTETIRKITETLLFYKRDYEKLDAPWDTTIQAICFKGWAGRTAYWNARNRNVSSWYQRKYAEGYREQSIVYFPLTMAKSYLTRGKEMMTAEQHALFIMAHERRHAAQNPATLLQACAVWNRISRAAADREQIPTVYNRAPYEVEANAIGYLVAYGYIPLEEAESYQQKTLPY